MKELETTLTTSGNSIAVRLPKDLLKMSGLGKHVTLQAKKGKIIISASTHSRQDWETQIKVLAEKFSDPTAEFKGLQSLNEGLEQLPWAGPSYEEWLHDNK